MDGSDRHKSKRPSGEIRQAFDPFFIFTYTLLLIALLIQIGVIFSMDFP